MKVEYIDTGIGYRYQDTIYLNQLLTDKPYLHDLVLDHELTHTKDWSWSDVWNDLKDFNVELTLWAIQNPCTWHALNPFKKINNHTQFNAILAGMYVILTIYLVFFLKLGYEAIKWIYRT